jgi:hypothetical protein
MSNYPPGVSGREYAIAGSDREWEEKAICEKCNQDQVAMMESYRNLVWWTC